MAERGGDDDADEAEGIEEDEDEPLLLLLLLLLLEVLLPLLASLSLPLSSSSCSSSFLLFALKRAKEGLPPACPLSNICGICVWRNVVSARGRRK